ncbi:MAG: HAD family hydrolase [Myxococcales bacterium]|jgi:phosphoglycolate phosphatase
MDVVLFDIDGTLVDAGGSGRKALCLASDALYGRYDLFDDVTFDGATDRNICKTALARHLPALCNDREVERLLAKYVEILASTLAETPRYRVYPGVLELLGRLADTRALVGLGTGNIEKGARLKLERGGLNPHFSFGGFGDDAEDRAAILRCGLQRAERLLGRSPRAPWVVGDTPRDLEAARAVGARVILVATGRYGLAELQSCAPDLCVESLEDPRVAEALGT